jgi:hypothetical protein
MAGARLKEAMSDLAETIRRVFQAPASHGVPVAVAVPCPGRIPPLAAAVRMPFVAATAMAVREDLLQAGAPVAVPLAWTAAVAGEPGWAAWETGARTCALPLFQAEQCARLEVPALPRRVGTRRQEPGFAAARSRSGWSGFPPPGTRAFGLGLGPVRTYRGLERMLTLPVGFQGEDLARISKALWMRYTLQMVRNTGENIRNLEVLGLYRIPAKGTRQVQHDRATGRLLVALGPEAAGAPRALFILARRKSDASTVCCFVEEA